MPIHVLSVFYLEFGLGHLCLALDEQIAGRSLDENVDLSVCADDVVRRNAGGSLLAIA